MIGRSLVIRALFLVVSAVGIGVAAWWFHREGTSPYRYLRDLRSSDPLVRTRAVSELENLRLTHEAEVAVPVLVETFHNNKDPHFRLQMAQALGTLGNRFEYDPILSRVLDAELHALNDPDPALRAMAARWLSMLLEDPERVVPALVRALDDPVPEVRRASAEAIGNQGGVGAVAAVPRLIQCAERDEDLAVRLAAIETLGRMFTAAKIVLPALDRALDDPQAAVRLQAVESLGHLRRAEPSARDRVLRALKDDADPGVRAAAAEALFYPIADAETVVPPLIAALQDPHPDVRRAAAGSLSFFPDADGRVLDPLVSALGDPEPDVRRHAASALERLGSRAERALPALYRTHENEPDVEVRLAIEDAVRAIEDMLLLEATHEP